LSEKGETGDGDREGIRIGWVPTTKSPLSIDGERGTDGFSMGSGVGELIKAALLGSSVRYLEYNDPMGAVSCENGRLSCI